MTMTRTTTSRHSSGLSPANAVQMVARAFATAWTTLRNRRQALRLSELDDHLLADIGLTRHDVEEARTAPLHTDPTIELAIRAAANTGRPRPRGRRGDRLAAFARYY